MTNWEKAKPGLDVIFGDLSLEDAVAFLDDTISCSYCKIWKFCTKERGITGEGDEDIVTNVACRDVFRKYLSMEAE